MGRVLEQRCRELEGQARLAEEGRRRLEQVLHQQQVQTDIAAQHRREAEDAYQQVRGSLTRLAGELQSAGGPDADVLARDLLTVVGVPVESAPTWPPPPVPPQITAALSSHLVQLVHLAGATRSSQRREWAIRGLCVLTSALVVSLVSGRLGAGAVDVAGVQVAAPALMAQPADTREQDAAWASLAPQLDSTWERDWPATVALLDGFLKQWPTYTVAEDKLYAALIADSQVHVQAGQVDDGVTELERAARLLPDRPEAWALLAQLAASAKP
jgi:hypothetical protein